MQTQATVTHSKSKYAMKRERRFFDLSQEAKKQAEIPIREMVKERLYSREGASCYHSGNPLAAAFNRAIQS